MADTGFGAHLSGDIEDLVAAYHRGARAGLLGCVGSTGYYQGTAAYEAYVLGYLRHSKAGWVKALVEAQKEGK